jgi:hypothetical protein
LGENDWLTVFAKKECLQEVRRILTEIKVEEVDEDFTQESEGDENGGNT